MVKRIGQDKCKKALTACFFDAPLGTITIASKQAPSFGIQGWILDSESRLQLTGVKTGLPFCFRWHGPFHEPEIALQITNSMEPFLVGGQWLHHGQQPVIMLSEPGWEPASGWLQQCQQMMTQALGRQPILLCDFSYDNDFRSEGILRMALPGHGAFREDNASTLNFQGCIYTSNYSNPYTSGLLVPLVPPPALDAAEDRISSFPEMRNHTPLEYKKLWEQTEALSRLMTSVNPSSAIRVVTSWHGHKAASCLNLKPSMQAKLGCKRNTRSMASGHPHKSWSHQAGNSKKRFALAIHGYHLDTLLEILESGPSEELREQATLLISLQRGMGEPMDRYLKKHDWSFELRELPNQGRDVLPFITYQLPRIAELGYHFFAKIHTKKSVHLKSGNNWGAWLGSEIINAVTSGAAGDLLEGDESIGLLAPEGSIAPMTLHLGKNIDWLQALAAHSEIPIETMLMSQFVAGTMMIGRVDAVSPLLNLGLTADNFETEAGQLDGTLAHAVERMIGAICASNGFKLESFKPEIFFDAGLGYKNKARS
jgi:hypothetical protein